MNSEIAPHPHSAPHGTSWAFVCSCIGHAALVAAIVLLFAAPRVGIFPVGPGESADKPLGDKGSAIVIIKPGRPLPGSGSGPAPTPVRTPYPTPAATPTATEGTELLTKPPVVTPAPKTAMTNAKIFTATSPPAETPKPMLPSPTPSVTQEAVPPETGIETLPGPGTTDKPSVENPPAQSDDRAGQVSAGSLDGILGGGGGIGTSVVLPAAYLDDLMSRLRANFAVPKNLQGLCVVEFTIARDGTLGDIKVHTSSGFAGLDEIALRAVRATARVRPFAEYTRVYEITATVPFHFEAAAN